MAEHKIRLAVLFGGPRGEREVSRRSATGPEKLGEVDVAFPALHGPHGEDGTVEELPKTAGTAFVGSDGSHGSHVLASEPFSSWSGCVGG